MKFHKFCRIFKNIWFILNYSYYTKFNCVSFAFNLHLLQQRACVVFKKFYEFHALIA
jgi:hypothetical protein